MNDIASVRVRGSAIRGLFREIKETHPGGIDPFMDKLGSSEKALFAYKVLGAGWYPYEMMIILLEMMNEVLADSSDYFHEVGLRSAERDFSRMFKLVTWLTKPHAVAKRGSAVWTHKFNRGRFDVTDVTDDSFVITIRDFPSIHRHHCRMVSGYVQGIGTHWRQTFRTEKTGCIHRGNPVCVYESRW